MRIILGFILMLFMLTPAFAQDEQAPEPQPQGRYCPQGTTDVNGVCKPACQPPLKRNPQGQCMASPCSEAQEIRNGRCVPKCPEGQEHTNNSNSCVEKCPGENMVRNMDGECVPSLCPPGQAVIGGRCAPLPPDQQ